MQCGLTACLGKKINRQLPTEHILHLNFGACANKSYRLSCWLDSSMSEVPLLFEMDAIFQHSSEDLQCCLEDGRDKG